MPTYVRYSDDLETIKPDEGETFQKIIELMSKEMPVTREKYGRDVRTSHAKPYALLKGHLLVPHGLPPEYAQGLFAQPGRYEVVVRMAAAPGEILDDSKVNATRGMGIKVLQAPGEKLAGYTGEAHDFVLAPGTVFTAPNAATFLQIFKPNAELAPKLSDTTKGVVSDIARVTNAALHLVGVDSGKLDFFGHAKWHPMGEGHFSQGPLRYGDYVCKLGVVPDSPAMDAYIEKEMELKSENSLRELALAFLRENPAEYSVRVQLNTDLEKMPIEDATVVWSEEVQPYHEVARLVLPPQTAWDEAKFAYFDALSFCPSHTLAAHRPMGSINRARMAVYGAMAAKRLAGNGQTEQTPTSLEQVPD